MKLRTSTLALGLLLTIGVSNTYAADVVEKPAIERKADMTDDQKKVRIEEIKLRVAEIKEMDKSEMSRADRKAMRKELREMNKEAKEMKGGVYLSVGALIIIILLLILIL